MASLSLPAAVEESRPALGCRDKLSQLHTTGDAIFFRVSELQARPEALQLARQYVDLTMHSVQGWSSTKPWINATDTDSLLAEVCACWPLLICWAQRLMHSDGQLSCCI